MRRLILIAAVVIVLLVSGGLTAQLIAQNGNILPILIQTGNPDASVTQVLPWKAEQFFLLVALFIVPGVLTTALALGGLMWFLDRSIRREQAEAKAAGAKPAAPAAESKAPAAAKTPENA